MPDDPQESYLKIAEYVISLGYMPVLKGEKQNRKNDFKNQRKSQISMVGHEVLFAS